LLLHKDGAGQKSSNQIRNCLKKYQEKHIFITLCYLYGYSNSHKNRHFFKPALYKKGILYKVMLIIKGKKQNIYAQQ